MGLNQTYTQADIDGFGNGLGIAWYASAAMTRAIPGVC